MAFVGSGSAKLILFGEHAVVHGHMALGCAIPGSVTVSWEPSPSPLEVRAPGSFGPAVKAAFLHVAAVMAVDQPGGLVVASGDIPPESGFGSSGALCVAIARCIDAGIQTGTQKTSMQTLWTAANEAEKLFHGRPSGVDTGLAILGSLASIEPGTHFPPTAHLLAPSGITIVYGAVPRVSSCAANVAAVGAAMAAGDSRVMEVIARLGRLSTEAMALFTTSTDQTAAEGKPALLGALANEAMLVLRDLGLSTPELDRLLELGLHHGALGGKLSGGGGGGAFWLACPDEKSAHALVATLAQVAHGSRLPGDGYLGVTTI